jgi:hypothetical protein
MVHNFVGYLGVQVEGVGAIPAQDPERAFGSPSVMSVNRDHDRGLAKARYARCAERGNGCLSPTLRR